VSDPTVLVRHEAGVLTLVLNRPQRANAFTFEMLGLLLQQLDRAAHDDEVRAAVIIGAGRSFSSGDDVLEKGEAPFDLPPGSHPILELPQRLVKAWYWLRKPTIAAVRGHCYGLAHDLALAADFRVVSRRTTFGDRRARIAAPVATGGSYLLPRLIGMAAATSLLLTGDTLDAEAMDRHGLVSRLVDDESLEQEAAALGSRLAALATRSAGLTKYQIRRGLELTFAEALELERELHDAPVEDRSEGVRAFAERRPPRFTGR
jgi:2-(1,2-epoxy-1,2-dihydrophenyl)acetyl-CoA isomerase